MIGLLIITHETLGAAYTRLAEHFFPHFDFHHVAILNVETDDDHENIIRRAHTDSARPIRHDYGLERAHADYSSELFREIRIAARICRNSETGGHRRHFVVPRIKKQPAPEHHH